MPDQIKRPILSLPAKAPESTAQQIIRLCGPLVGERISLRLRSSAYVSGRLDALTTECLRIANATITYAGKSKTKGVPLIIIRANHCDFVAHAEGDKA